jgi:hypothetical protein
MLVALTTLGVFALALTLWRFDHPELTETQLTLWSLERWWGWLPAAVAGGIAGWLVRE